MRQLPHVRSDQGNGTADLHEGSQGKAHRYMFQNGTTYPLPFDRHRRLLYLFTDALFTVPERHRPLAISTTALIDPTHPALV